MSAVLLMLSKFLLGVAIACLLVMWYSATRGSWLIRESRIVYMERPERDQAYRDSADAVQDVYRWTRYGMWSGLAAVLFMVVAGL